METLTAAAQLCRNYINGEWIASKTARIVERRNPANTDDVVARIPLSTREEMKQAIVALAGPRDWFGNRQSWIAKSARAAGISYRSAKALFYEETQCPNRTVVGMVRAAVAKMSMGNEASANDEYAALRERVERLEAALCLANVRSEDFDGGRSPLHDGSGSHRANDQ